MSVALLLGWVVGILVGIVAFIALSAAVSEGGDRPLAVVAAVVRIATGLVLLAIAAAQWRRRRADRGGLPTWLAAADSITAARAFGFGVLVAVANPKNLLLTASAGLVVSSAPVTIGELVLVVALFTVLGSSTVSLLVLANLLSPTRMRGPLEGMRRWLIAHNATVVVALLLVVGLWSVGQGIAGL